MTLGTWWFIHDGFEWWLRKINWQNVAPFTDESLCSSSALPFSTVYRNTRDVYVASSVIGWDRFYEKKKNFLFWVNIQLFSADFDLPMPLSLYHPPTYPSELPGDCTTNFAPRPTNLPSLGEEKQCNMKCLAPKGTTSRRTGWVSSPDLDLDPDPEPHTLPLGKLTTLNSTRNNIYEMDRVLC